MYPTRTTIAQIAHNTTCDIASAHRTWILVVGPGFGCTSTESRMRSLGREESDGHCVFDPLVGCCLWNQVHPVYNPVAPYRYPLPTVYLAVADISNPDLFACGCRPTPPACSCGGVRQPNVSRSPARRLFHLISRGTTLSGDIQYIA